MKLRRPPKNIPLYSLKSARRYVCDSVYNGAVGEIVMNALMVIASLCAVIVLIPVFVYYFVKDFARATYDIVRYCTYSLNNDEEQRVQRHIERISKL